MKALLIITAYLGLVLLLCSIFKINPREVDE